MSVEEELLPETLQKLGLRPDSPESDQEQRLNDIPSSSPLSSSCSTGAPSASLLQPSQQPLNPFYGTSGDPRQQQQINHWSLLFKDTPTTSSSSPCLTCGGHRQIQSEATTTEGIGLIESTINNIRIEEAPLCFCPNSLVPSVATSNSHCDDTEDLLHQKRLQQFRSCFLDKEDRKWKFFNHNNSKATTASQWNNLSRSRLRGGGVSRNSNQTNILREPILKLKRFGVDFRDDTQLTHRLSFSEVQSRHRTASGSGHRERRRMRETEEDSFVTALDRQEETPLRWSLPALGAEGGSQPMAQGGSSSSSSSGPVQSCSQQALLNCDVTIDELASYFETFVHIPRKMSSIAETMYT